MSVHISANKGDIAKVVLQPGDPLRAQYIAENFLENVRLVSKTRNIFYFTGEYKGKTVSVGASGMGCPSIGIYSYELYTEYDVDTIIRIGTCGAYSTDLKLYDVLNVENAASESTYAKYAWEIEGDILPHQGKIFDLINDTAQSLDIVTKKTNIHTSDIFYRKTPGTPAVAEKYNCSAVEMEAFALFANAQYLGKNAATILTVSDIIPTREEISADQRERALKPMIELALETAIKL
ncbi:purine-nucleoside phosphorylase [Elizabethkingia meningoseptica]|uniref:purine-nucleoside phosphorylase n=1 Tax=Elizabethkingia meningoseptica TaxID=238 RepID=UPI000332D3B3|nr:purine-nucleoside phosphorylase [Elizabethkingia meningoseptica]AQX03824.1 purine-nucleoside phosphorylase [Elizabethkingia meningoseptica]AQX45863.1 purine nucleoside phosphorylase DeoD-type [Elizabethkingia meningoseptica]EOR30142.1 Purine nucleoside phosphorylase [Elizabethkingia meningoseptica ATCC 13253 = NBRC 12535]KUY15156.1 purine nucleoside phosphorylase DeoD-type [Elizabethkingia meningoseptica]MCL1674067.1 purine-nucleoside phosphorylase [Elizabethkingia meningoseptica]